MTLGLDGDGGAAPPEYRAYYESFCKRWRLCPDYQLKFPVDEHYPGLTVEDVNQAWKFGLTVGNRYLGYFRGLCLSADGYLCMVSRKAKAGHQICVLLGGDVPFVLRPDKNRRTYSLVSEACVHGFMQGEALELRLPIQDITIR